jgi:hypothetical protein
VAEETRAGRATRLESWLSIFEYAVRGPTLTCRKPAERSQADGHSPGLGYLYLFKADGTFIERIASI